MALADVQTAIQGLESALAADSANPQPTYTLNGKTVQRSEWRESMTRTLESLKKQQQAYQPFLIRTRQVL